MTRHEDGSWSSLSGMLSDSVRLRMDEFCSVPYLVFGIREKLGKVAFSDNEEIIGYDVLLLNDYVTTINLLWESNNPYDILFSKPIHAKNIPTFDYYQTYKFGLTKGRKNAKNPKMGLEFLNLSLPKSNQKILRITSEKRLGMLSFTHQVKRLNNDFALRFSSEDLLEL